MYVSFPLRQTFVSERSTVERGDKTPIGDLEGVSEGGAFHNRGTPYV